MTHIAYQRMRRVTNRREVSLSTLAQTEGQTAPGEQGVRGVTERSAALAGTDPAEHAEQAARRAAVLQALGTLTQKQREAVVLRYYIGCSDREMAAILGCSAGTARQRLHAGRAALEHVN